MTIPVVKKLERIVNEEDRIFSSLVCELLRILFLFSSFLSLSLSFSLFLRELSTLFP